MDSNLLVGPTVPGGLALVPYLEERIGEIRAALWVQEEDDQPWRLWIAPRRRDLAVPDFYQEVAIAVAAHRAEVGGLMASDTKLVSPDHPIMGDLRIVAPVDGTPPVPLSGHMLGGYFLPKAIVLRMR